jgi:hypothetical protein
MKVFVRPNSAAERGFHSRAVMPKPEVLAPGLPPTPEHNLIFHGGKTIANLSYANFYVGGADAWDANNIQSIDTALAAAMTDQNLNNVMVQYYPDGKISTAFQGSQILAGPPPAVVSQGDVETLVSSMCNAGQFDNLDLSSTVVNFLLPSGTILNTNVDPTSPAINARAETPPTQATVVKKALRPAVVPQEDEEDSTQGLGGYHGSVHVGAAPEKIVYYAVGVFSEQLADGRTNGIVCSTSPGRTSSPRFITS